MFATLSLVNVHLHVLCLVVSDSLGSHGLQSTRLLCPRDSPGENTGVGSYSILQGIFPTPALHADSLPSKPGLIIYPNSFYYYDLMLTQHILFYTCSNSDWDKVVKDFVLLLPPQACLCRGLTLYKYTILQFYKSEVRHRSYWDKTEVSTELYSFPEAFSHF